MHEGELEISSELVRALIAQQFPRWGGLTVTRVRSTGTVNAIFRLGADLCVRLPRKPDWAGDLDREQRWLPWLASRLTEQIPLPVASGQPTSAFPHPWAIYDWIAGQPYADDLVEDEVQAARDLARFVLELRAVDVVLEAPPAGRRPLEELDVDTRAAIGAADGVIDGESAAAAWTRALNAPVWSGPPVWIHTDLLRPNVLVDDGRIRAVIDFGGVGVGDPAADVIAAWSVFGSAGRATYRTLLDVDDGTWERARGYALHQAAMIIPYYRETNPGFVALARRTVEQVLSVAD